MKYLIKTQFFLRALQDLEEKLILKLRSDISGLGQVTERSSIVETGRIHQQISGSGQVTEILIKLRGSGQVTEIEFSRI